MIDLNSHHLETVNAILAEHVPDCEVRAFGSRATWTAKDYSDLDLAVVGEGPLDWKALGRLKEDFEESNLPMRVDVLDWHSISESFRKAIKRDCVVIQRRGKKIKTGDWRKVTLGNSVVINDDTYSPKEAWAFVNYLDTGSVTENRISETQHLVLGKDKIPSRARRKVQPGDIVYSTVRPNQRHFGLIREPSENFLVSTGFATIRGKEGLALTEYVYWFLVQDHIVEHLHTIAVQSTSAYPSIKPSDIERLELELPPLPEQRRIAHILGTLDDKIELNRRMNATLEGMARALFKSWFVDFEPARAKMEGRWRRGESLPGMPAELYDLFPERLAPSELGEAPEGWGVKTLGDIADSPRRGVSPADVESETPYIGLQHMPRRSIALTEWATAGQVSSAKSIFRRGELLFGKLRPYFHKVGIAAVDGVCSTDILVVVPNMNEWSSFLLCCVSSDEFVAYTDQTSTGTRMPRTSWKAMKQYGVFLPPNALVSAFQGVTEPLLKRIIMNCHESQILAVLRDALLPGLVSGELRVNKLVHG